MTCSGWMSQSLLRQRIIQVVAEGAAGREVPAVSQSLLRQGIIQVTTRRCRPRQQKQVSIASSSANHSGRSSLWDNKAPEEKVSIASSSANHSGQFIFYSDVRGISGLNRFFVSESFRSTMWVKKFSFVPEVSIASSSANHSGQQRRLLLHVECGQSQSLLRQRIIQVFRIEVHEVGFRLSLNRFFVSESFRSAARLNH